MADPVVDGLEQLLEAIGKRDDFDGEVITDAVLIVGSQYVDEDGDRCGHVFMFPRNGSQPSYITLGPIETARSWMGNSIGS